ncbi:TetR/AcrR family transcriptional regulator [Nonomuraea sp. 3-1Str]|uniref:TetR/AcrR family transcriptional regulator n=1 Tax=unclassified Nonomuraea TaxID=2593643 RepID=UPI002854D975|nr:TetR/AcrR family transcriptional regulator [Nonomuraea sp. 3-1Str]MDR8409148.1 TetR/AcrR family transcriptional regulator [Nonomuraea sp. 3-1Str]
MNAGPATGRPSTKERIMAAGAELFRRQGYTGTGLKQIVAEAEAPFGSIYHFFPGGKEQLGAEVVRRSGAGYGRLFTAVMEEAPDPVTGVRDFFAGAARTLVETGYADACPIATVALEVASTSEPLRQATVDVFTEWIALGTGFFTRAGAGEREARELVITLLSALEGAFVLSRALRTTEPLEIAGESIAARTAALFTPTP